jgi:hypothetical protein
MLSMRPKVLLAICAWVRQTAMTSHKAGLAAREMGKTLPTLLQTLVPEVLAPSAKMFVSWACLHVHHPGSPHRNFGKGPDRPGQISWHIKS